MVHYRRLPPKSSFFNSLKDEDITQEDYDHAKNLFEQFGCRSLRDYHDLYVSGCPFVSRCI